MKRKTEKKKVVKRITAIISAASVMTAAFGFVLPVSAAAPVQGTLPFYASFSETYSGGRGSYTTADTGDELYGKAWKLSGWEAQGIKLGSAALTDKKLAVSFDLKVDALTIATGKTDRPVCNARFSATPPTTGTDMLMYCDFYAPLQIRASADKLIFKMTNGQYPNDNNTTPANVSNPKAWHRVDMVLDVNNTTGTTVDFYVDGSKIGTQSMTVAIHTEYKDESKKDKVTTNSEKKMNSIYAYFMDPLDSKTTDDKVYIDNLNIRETSAMTVASSSYDNTTRTLNVEFNDTIAANVADTMKVVKSNYTDQSVVDASKYTVTKPTANTLKIKFDEGALASSSEYTLKGVSSVFGSTAADISFTVPSSKSFTYTETFENATADSEDATKINGLNEKITLTNGDATLNVVDGNGGGRALKIFKAVGAGTSPSVQFKLDGLANVDSRRRLGKVTYSFDFKQNTTNGVTAYPTMKFTQGFNQSHPNNGNQKFLAEFNTGRNEIYDQWRQGATYNNWRIFVKDYKTDVWHNLKFVLDYDNLTITYYYDGSEAMSISAADTKDAYTDFTAPYSKTNTTKEDFDRLMNDTISYDATIKWNNTVDADTGKGTAATGLDYTIDNFSIEYEETATVGMDEDNDISIKNLTVAPVTGDDTANYVVTAKAVNTYAATKTANIIVCGYDANGVLVDVQLRDVTLGALCCTEVSEKFNLTAANNIASVRAFAWNGVGSLVPLGQSAQYPVGK